MPFINRPKPKQSPPEGNRAIRQKIYGTTRWRQLRLSYLMSHPLCERCLREDVITQAEDVHHIVGFMKANDMPSMKDLAYNPENLQSLCRNCHSKLHRKTNV